MAWSGDFRQLRVAGTEGLDLTAIGVRCGIRFNTEVMDNPRRRRAAAACLVLAALTAAGCAPGQGAPGGSALDSGSHVNTTSYTISQPVTQLTLDNLSGTVSVTSADGPVSVTETLTYTDDKPGTSHQVTGDTLALASTGCPRVRALNGRCQVRWEVRAPAATNLRLSNESGGLTVRGMSGTVTAETQSGGVEGRNLTSRSVTATAQSGGVKLTFTQPPDQVTASSQSGGVDVVLPTGVSYAVQTDTQSGGQRVRVPTDSSSPHKISASTQSGSVEVSSD